MFCQVIIIGHLGNDPEIKEVGRDSVVANFSVATNYTYKDRDGNKQKETTWHSCVAWNGIAEIVEKYTKKGSKVQVIGRIKHEKYKPDWADKEVTVPKIIVDSILLLDNKEDDDHGSRRGRDEGGRGNRGESNSGRGSRGESGRGNRGSGDEGGSTRGRTRSEEPPASGGAGYDDDIPF